MASGIESCVSCYHTNEILRKRIFFPGRQLCSNKTTEEKLTKDTFGSCRAIYRATYLVICRVICPAICLCRGLFPWSVLGLLCAARGSSSWELIFSRDWSRCRCRCRPCWSSGKTAWPARRPSSSVSRNRSCPSRPSPPRIPSCCWYYRRVSGWS